MPWQAAWDVVGEGFNDADGGVQEDGERTDDEYAEEPGLKEEEVEAKEDEDETAEAEDEGQAEELAYSLISHARAGAAKEEERRIPLTPPRRTRGARRHA